MATLKITGVTEIARALEQLGPKLGRKVIRQEIRKALKPVAAAVKARTPSRSGNLRRLVKVRAATKRRRGVIALEVNINADRQGKTFYGAFVNFGTKKIKPRHFVEDAFAETKDKAAADVVAGITAAIEREARP